MPDQSLFLNSSLPFDLQQIVDSDLDDGEELLWVGQPKPSRMAKRAIPIVLFGIPWTAFAVFWVCMALSMTGDDGIIGVIFPLFGLPFVFIGLGMLSAPFWARKRALKTCFALTNSRAIIWQSRLMGSIDKRSFDTEMLSDIQSVAHSDGTGDLIFKKETQVHYSTDDHGFSRSRVSTTNVGFIAIENHSAVEKLIRKMRKPESQV